MTNIENNFYNANEAFEYFYKTISKYGTDFANTKALFNIGFAIHKPMLNEITIFNRMYIYLSPYHHI